MSLYNSLNLGNHYPICLKYLLLNLTELDSNIKHIKSSNYEKRFDEIGKLTYIKSWDKITEFKYDKNGRLVELKVTNWDSGEREFTKYDIISFNYLETDDNYRIVIINNDCRNGYVYSTKSSIEIIDYYENNENRIEEHRIYDIILNIEKVLPKYVIQNSNQLIIENNKLDQYPKYKDWEFEVTNLILRVFPDIKESYMDKHEKYVDTYCLGLYSKKIFDINNRCIEHIEYKFNEKKLPYFEDSFFKNTESIDSDYLDEFYYCFTSGSLSDIYLEKNLNRKTKYIYDENNYCYAEIFDSISYNQKQNLVFDNNKKLIQNCIIYNDGDEIMNIFEYDVFGNITKESKVNGKFEDVYHYEYNANNKWIKKFKNKKLLIERQVEYYT